MLPLFCSANQLDDQVVWQLWRSTAAETCFHSNYSVTQASGRHMFDRHNITQMKGERNSLIESHHARKSWNIFCWCVVDMPWYFADEFCLSHGAVVSKTQYVRIKLGSWSSCSGLRTDCTTVGTNATAARRIVNAVICQGNVWFQDSNVYVCI